MDVTQSALQGMQRAQEMLETAGARMARIPETAVQSGPDADTIDLSTEMVALLQSRNLFETNVKVAQTAGDMDRSVLEIIG